ncbi:MAG: hypothetical protein KF760_25265 [Candidatus Eremiobacteraeota bacterium]|nr:hypothetical protein [Candidatus Eremiobacteraeota bacterium]MCW5872115.1 hypothetical protein [Candidatus Eremiobacteraeota bacterium]
MMLTRNLIVGLGIVGLLSAGASAQGRRHHNQYRNYNNRAYYNKHGYYNNQGGYNYNLEQYNSWNPAWGSPYQNGNNGYYNYNYNYNYPNNGYYYNNGYQYNAAGQIINGLLNRRW